MWITSLALFDTFIYFLYYSLYANLQINIQNICENWPFRVSQAGLAELWLFLPVNPSGQPGYSATRDHRFLDDQLFSTTAVSFGERNVLHQPGLHIISASRLFLYCHGILPYPAKDTTINLQS